MDFQFRPGCAGLLYRAYGVHKGDVHQNPDQDQKPNLKMERNQRKTGAPQPAHGRIKKNLVEEQGRKEARKEEEQVRKTEKQE